MSLAVYSAKQDGTCRVPLDTVGRVGALTYANTWPGGDSTCSFTLDVPASANPDALTLGRIITVYDGLMPAWKGMLADPQRGAAWSLSAQGLASLGSRYVALTSNTTRTTLSINANTAVPNAIARGLPWLPPPTFPAPTVAPDGPDVNTLLDAVALASSQQWGVGPDGSPFMQANPTVPTYLLVSTTTPGGRTTDDFATDLWARYGSDSSSKTVVEADKNPPLTASRPFGRYEAVYDTTPAGSLSATQAQQMADGVLAKIGPDPSFTGALTVNAQDLLNIGGTPARLAAVRSGSLVRMVGIQPDPVLGQTLFSLSVNVIIGEWDYDADTNSATLTPMGAVKRDLASLLVAAAATDDS